MRSSANADYQSVIMVISKVVWVRDLMKEFCFKIQGPNVLANHECTKHIYWLPFYSSKTCWRSISIWIHCLRWPSCKFIYQCIEKATVTTLAKRLWHKSSFYEGLAGGRNLGERRSKDVSMELKISDHGRIIILVWKRAHTLNQVSLSKMEFFLIRNSVLL